MLHFSIPDFYGNFGVNRALLELRGARPEMFREDVVIDSVYGCFPSAIWNGGRIVFGVPSAENVHRTLKFYNDRGIECRLTFTNSLLAGEHLDDTWCHIITRAANNGRNAVIINSEVLESHLRKLYPEMRFISSTTKCIGSIGQFNAELAFDYDLCVLPYDFNNNFDALAAINAPERTEIIVNEFCVANCPARKAHYYALSKAQLFYEQVGFSCVAPSHTYEDVMQRPHYISYDDIKEKYERMGFNHFKVVGRGAPLHCVVEAYVQYFVKPEFQPEARELLLGPKGGES